MKKVVQWFLIIFAVVIGISCLGAQTSEATQLVRKRTNHTKLSDYGYYKRMPNVFTPAENTFVMQYGAETEVVPLTENADTSQVTVDEQHPSGSALVKNVGWYQGKKVSVKISLLKNLPNYVGGTVALYPQHFLSTTVIGDIDVTYEFFDENDQPVNIETTINSYNLNKNCYFGFSNVPFKWLYGYEPTNVFSRTWNDEVGGYWVTYHNETDATSAGNANQQMEVVTNPTSKLQFIYRNNSNQPIEFPYRTDFVAKPEFGPAFANSVTLAQPANETTSTAQQVMPNVGDDQKLSQLEMHFNLANIQQSNQYQVGALRITNFQGEDITDLFSQERTGDELVVTARQPHDPRLYATTLLYELKLSWQQNAQPVDNRFIDEKGNLALPYSIKTKAVNVNGTFDKKVEASLKVNYNSRVNVVFLDENNQPLRDPFVQTGILTQPFDVSTVYPDIPGYYPVKNQPAQDQGFFDLTESTIIHHYQKNLKFQLKNSGDILRISRFSNEATVAYSLKHESGKPVRIMARLGNEEQLIKDYKTADEEFTDQVTFKVPEPWLGQEVEFYAESPDHQQSNIEKRRLEKEIGPQVSGPKQLSFGQQEIPFKDRYVNLASSQSLTVTDTSVLDKSRWTLKVKLSQALKNQKGQVLKKRLLFKHQDKWEPINESDQPIISTSGSQTVDLADLLKLYLTPADHVSAYQGQITWTLEDAPV